MNAERIFHYFPGLDARQQSRIRALAPVYRAWNSKINVISRQDMDNFYLHHVLHSLGIAKTHPFKPGTTVLDAGTGGGFPGIPLAILFPETQFHLVDSIAKKLKVVAAVVAELQLQNVTFQQTRVEELPAQYDFTVSRAVARMRTFYHWVHRQLKPGGRILYLKGGDLTAEMSELQKPYTLYNLNTFFTEDFFTTKKVVEVKG